MFSVKNKTIWSNWSSSVVASPKHQVKPKNLQQLIAFVKECYKKNLSIRVVGAGHSFTPLVATNEVLISLDYLSGIEKVDRENHLVTVWAGSRLKDLSRQLNEHGYAFENLGDINEQSIAGAISTGTHGTGIKFGSIATQVTAITLLTAEGTLLEISATENNEYFNAAVISLGMLGIIVKVQLKVIPQYDLIESSFRFNLDEGLHKLDQFVSNNRNFEFFWFPYTDVIQVKTLNIADENRRTNETIRSVKNVAIENGLFWILSEMSRHVPKTSKLVSYISALGVPVGKEVHKSYIMYATPRIVKFNEMEYSIPYKQMSSVIKEIDQMLKKKRMNVHFPIECRYVKGDSLWLSPSYKQDSAYIAVHMYKGMDFAQYFKEVEEIFLAYGGRPHWGKMHSSSYDQLTEMYPKLKDFLKIRKELDPAGLFLNEYVRNLFQITST